MMARRAEKTPEFEVAAPVAASLPGCVRPVARPNLARGVPARPSRAFSWNSPVKVSEMVGGVASACSAIFMRRELDADACANGVTAGETATESRSERSNREPTLLGTMATGSALRVGPVGGREPTATSEIMDATAGRDRQPVFEQRGQGFLWYLSGRYRRGASVTAQCAPLSTSLLAATAAPPPAAVAWGGMA